MSKACKCDRCGKCFHQADTDRETVSIKEIIFTTSSDYAKNRFTRTRRLPLFEQDYFDLCPDCTADFNAFLEEGAKRVNGKDR